MGEWISVKNSLPDPNIKVLTFDGKDIVAEERLNDDRGVEWSTSYDVTHWMPLPEPPNA